MPEWSADVEVDEQLVRRLLGAQFPELALATVERFAEGWDNAVWLVDGRWAFRFPRRTIAVPLVERELAVLPVLAPRLPVAIPEPVFAGRAGEGYPWPFSGAALIPGAEAGDAALPDAARVRVASRLAAFVRALHACEVPGLPVDPNERGNMAKRVAMTLPWLDELEALGLWRAPVAARRLFDEALRLPPPEDEVVLHGDLHFRHVLVDAAGELTGVIDWGDVSRGDPSIDLSLYWSFFPPAARAAFRDGYGPMSAAQLVRARVLALSLCAALARYAHHEGMASVEREALSGLERAMIDG